MLTTVRLAPYGRVMTIGSSQDPYDVVVIGAGVCGLYQLYRLLGFGFRVTAVEANDDLGGTWYRNRYPGCRFDSESYTYGYSFSPELLAEWDWTERFAARPETLRYLNHIAGRFGLREHIQFGCRVVSADFDERVAQWTVTLADGRVLITHVLMTAIGMLSVPTAPRIPGQDTFTGPSFHTFDWPAQGIDLSGKRVAVVGTGATGVQVISTIAGEVAELTVFQRHANWCAPLRNSAIRPDEMARIKASYDRIFARCRETPSGFLHGPDPRDTFSVPEPERRAFWEERYGQPGFALWLGNFRDTLMDKHANAELSAFMAEKIRERVHDAGIADKLIPRDHGFGTKRVPLETGYYEVYNQPNVELVDLGQTPVVAVTPHGLRTAEREFELDVIVYATGFDAITGAFDRIRITGLGGRTLASKWADGPSTCLGVQTEGFPNLFTLVGPQSGSVATNFPRGIEDIVDWATNFLCWLRERAANYVEATAAAEHEWVDHVKEMSERVLLSRSKSWFTGYNSNLDRDDRPRYMVYTGGAVRYRRRLADEAAAGYPSFTVECRAPGCRA
jgi:cation diffusion facilitator CzcD-associated flavoprotein CzcO